MWSWIRKFQISNFKFQISDFVLRIPLSGFGTKGVRNMEYVVPTGL